MSVEYVKLAIAERDYAEKSLLKIQAQFISVLQHLSNYHSARDEELKLKLELKNKIQEVKESIENLDKVLPKSNFKDHQVLSTSESSKKLSSSTPIVKEIYHAEEETKEDKLQRELEEIRRKLSRLK